MPTFTTNVGTSKDPRILVDGQSKYARLDFEVFKPDDFYARLTANITNEDGEPVRDVSACLEYADSDEKHQSVYATKYRHQFTRRDGKLNDFEIWPTYRPVRLHIGPKDPNGPYPLQGMSSEPFIIEPQQSYHLDMVLSYQRAMVVQVVDVEGDPLEGVSVSVRDGEQGFPIFPASIRREGLVLTDADGFAEVSGMLPGEDVFLVAQRWDANESVGPAGTQCPLISMVGSAKAPSDRDKPLVEVAFDERPIVVEGQLDIDVTGGMAWVYVGLPQEPGREPRVALFRIRTDDQGGFVLRGVPAGTVRIGYGALWPDGRRADGHGIIVVEPGNRYRIGFAEQGLQLFSRQPMP